MIDKSYVLFTRIQITKLKNGNIFCDPLWAKDLNLHLDYINDFKICCPVVYSEDVDGLEDITDYNIKHIFELRKDYGFSSVIRNILPNFFRVVKACKQAKIVHSGGAEWSFPLSFYLVFLKPFFHFQWVMVIESSFWMLAKNEKLTFRKIFEHYIHKFILTRCVKDADARIFTQSYYRKFFLKNETDRTLIAPATWINKDNLVTENSVEKRILLRKGKPLQVIFPARLEDYKGVFVLFKTINLLKDANISVNITIMGTGTLENKCKDFSLKNFGNVKVSFHEPVKYGSTFLNELCKYDAVLVPNLKEEQPRIIFDAFSQGLGVIASDTSGILDITVDGENAIICKRNDPDSLAKAICHLVNNPHLSLNMGIKGLEYAHNKTHLQMHLDRQKFFANVLDIS